MTTLLLNEGVPRALKGKNLRLKNPMLLHSIFDEMNNTIGGQFLEHCHLIWNCPWFLKRWWLLFNLSNLRALPAKSKCKNALRFLMKKTSFAPLINNFLYFFKESKVICQRGKTFFLIRNLRVFCIYFLQVLKSDYEGIACKIYFLIPSNFDEK